MKNIIKTAIIAIALTTVALTANAQSKGDMAAGAKIAFGTGTGYSNLGIGAKFQYNVTDPLRLEAGFTYFLPKNNVNMWDFSVNAHWLFPVSEGINLYPMAGLGMWGTRASYMGYSAGVSEVAFNLGGGADFKLSDSMFFNAEAKYLVSGGGLLVLSAGLGFMF
ncbi:MAG: porin family protein [Alistipes sp.]|jgi:outer membrane protein X|nr:porin family protein [Alistipes sp.]